MGEIVEYQNDWLKYEPTEKNEEMRYWDDNMKWDLSNE
jgi:hypothetical protein